MFLAGVLASTDLELEIRRHELITHKLGGPGTSKSIESLRKAAGFSSLFLVLVLLNTIQCPLNPISHS
jgi:hypothetical protein